MTLSLIGWLNWSENRSDKSCLKLDHWDTKRTGYSSQFPTFMYFKHFFHILTKCTALFVTPVPITSYLLNYLLTPWCRVPPEKPTGLQLVKTFPVFHRTRRFITALTSVRHLSLSHLSCIYLCATHTIFRESLL